MTNVQVNPQPPAPTPVQTEDDDTLTQGLTPEQLDVLAQKVFDLWLDELRIEDERFGQRRG